MTTYQDVAVHENNDIIYYDRFTRIQVSPEIEVLISMETMIATLFYGDIDFEFRFNSKTGAMINRMIDSDFKTKTYLMQLLRQNYEVKPYLLNS